VTEGHRRADRYRKGHGGTEKDSEEQERTERNMLT